MQPSSSDSASQAPQPPSAFNPSASPPRSRSETFVLIAGVLLGALIFFGLFSVHAIYLVPVPCPSVSGCTPTTQAQANYINTIRGLAWFAVGALDLSAGLSVALAFVAASRAEIPESTRRSVFLFATVFTSIWAVGSFILLSYLSIVRYYYVTL